MPIDDTEKVFRGKKIASASKNDHSWLDKTSSLLQN